MTITINGSGTITGVSAGGLPSGTVTQATLATPVAGTGPAFSATMSANQAVLLQHTQKLCLIQKILIQIQTMIQLHIALRRLLLAIIK